MTSIRALVLTSAVLPLAAALVAGQAAAPPADGGSPGGATSWRYYRVGNTGIQGDYNEALWIGPDGDPYIGGYDPIFEEGGFSKFVQAENRWINYSNVDYPVIGHPSVLGSARVNDIVALPSGRLWMATWTGALSFDPSLGAPSLTNYGAANSPLVGQTTDLDLAPDGTLWFVSGGLVRHDPATSSWTSWSGGQLYLAAQPKAGGGYFVWSADSYFGYVFRYDSATGLWTNWLPQAKGEVAGMPGKDCVDDAGNFWAFRMAATPGGWETLDYLRPDGTWVSPPPPYPSVSFDTWAFKAYGNGRALLVDGNGGVWRFDGSAWSGLGQWKAGAYTYAVDVDAAGNVWAAGVGGAAKRSAATGQWQRYRITNTGNFDDFNRDLTIDAAQGHVYAGANAGPGVGGMARFDGARWMGWNQLTYGLGHDWPFPNDSCHALAVRPSIGRVAVSPLTWLYGIHEWTGSQFQPLLPTGGAARMCEDSLGRLWALGEYYDLKYLDAGGWHPVPIVAWGAGIRPDPTLPGAVWAWTGYQFLRTDGASTFARDIGSFPELTTQSDQFSGLATEAGGVAWVGCTVHLGIGGTGGGLIRIDAETGEYEMLRYDQGWPFPGQFVTPWATTPDGRLWMSYDSNYPSTARGLCWWDGTQVRAFPAPPDGGPQWGGLPHAQIEDLEVRGVPGGYELWMSCVSRGLAVLTVKGTLPAWTDLGSGLPGIAGVPALAGEGTLVAGSPGSLTLTSAKPSSPGLLFVSLASVPTPFKGGVLLAFPPALTLLLGTSAAGSLSLPFTWPPGVPAGTTAHFQLAVQDAAAPFGTALSNGLKAVTP